MQNPPPIPYVRPQEEIDEANIKVLIVFHYVIAGLSVLGLLFLAFHYFMFNTFFMNPSIWENAEGSPPPMEFFEIFRWFYLFMAVLLVGYMAANLFSAVFMGQRHKRMFSLVVGCVNCLQFPLGTVLGIFTIIVLMRPSVQSAYERSDRS